MSYLNPTPIRIGMTGTINGRQYRVVGRVVMGADVDGETYYWNEFNLVGVDNRDATLVYEVTERGGEWRLFAMFEPEAPMTAADAATKCVGDRLNLDGRTDVRVTLVDESRVYHIEGQAPEGVEVGDIAHYFNAEAGSEMQVVSWTGDEVEFYRGVTVSRGLIASAFGVRIDAPPVSSFSSSATDDDSSSSNNLMRLIAFIIIAVVLYLFYGPALPHRQRVVPPKISAPVAPFTARGEGRIDGKNYQVRGHAVMEIARVGQVFDRHEYQLVDENENRAVLVYGLKPGNKEWFLFTPLQPLEPMTPLQAAALRMGDTVNVDGYIAPVNELFKSTIRQMESYDTTNFNGGTAFYSFSAQTNSIYLLVRWNESGINFYRGKTLPANEVNAAFIPTVKN
jgi:hypothetical protein